MDEMGAMLEREIEMFASQGWVLESHTEGMAQLRKEKKFNVGYAILNWVFLSWAFGLGVLLGIIQIILHAGARDRMMVLTEDGDGKVKVKKTSA